MKDCTGVRLLKRKNCNCIGVRLLEGVVLCNNGRISPDGTVTVLFPDTGKKKILFAKQLWHERGYTAAAFVNGLRISRGPGADPIYVYYRDIFEVAV